MMSTALYRVSPGTKGISGDLAFVAQEQRDAGLARDGLLSGCFSNFQMS